MEDDSVTAAEPPSNTDLGRTNLQAATRNIALRQERKCQGPERNDSGQHLRLEQEMRHIEVCGGTF